MGFVAGDETGNTFKIDVEERKEAQPNRKKHAELGYYTAGENIEDLAEKLELDVKKIRSEIEAFNQAVEKKEKDPYRKTPSAFKLNPEGPMYSALIEPAIHMTSGSLVSNEKAQVINNRDRTIPGLYAAGEVTNQSGGFSQSIAFGRIAGKEAAKYVLRGA